MEISAINFTGKTFKIRGDKKFIRPDANKENVLNFIKTERSKIKAKSLKDERIQQALNAPKKNHEVKRALQEYLHLNYYC